MNNAAPHTLIVITGPTAAGKTAAAVGLARRLGTEIISADSRQCYHEMSIGTAKPSEEETGGVKHYFIDTFPVTEPLTAADYERLALGYAEEIFSRHNTAVVCGGTGLYIRALCEGLDEMPATDPEINADVQASFRALGMVWLQQAVCTEDPLFYKTGETENPVRMIRALAFRRSTGRSIVEFRTAKRKKRPFRILKAGLELPAKELYRRIDRRVDRMMQDGLLAEAAGLFHLRHLKNLQTVGYSELFDYLEGKSSIGYAVEKIKQHTRNYAKRQMTWFRKDKEIQWFDADDPQLTDKLMSLPDNAGVCP